MTIHDLPNGLPTQTDGRRSIPSSFPRKITGPSSSTRSLVSVTEALGASRCTFITITTRPPHYAIALTHLPGPYSIAMAFYAEDSTAVSRLVSSMVTGLSTTPGPTADGAASTTRSAFCSKPDATRTLHCRPHLIRLKRGRLTASTTPSTTH